MPRLPFLVVLFACVLSSACRTESFPPYALQQDAGATDLRRSDLSSSGTSAIGDPCTVPGGVFGPGTCPSDRMICAQEGFPGGYCTQVCNRDSDTSCPAGSKCFFVSPGTHRCMKLCASDNECRDGYECDFQGFCERTFSE